VSIIWVDSGRFAATAAPTPVDFFGSKLEGWYSASGPFTTATGVSVWNDLGGKNNHLLQASGSLQPTVGTFASRAAVIFDGTNDFMETTTVVPVKLAVIACFGYPNNNSLPPFAWSSIVSGNFRQELHLSSNGSVRSINDAAASSFADTPTGTTESFYDDCTLVGAYGPAGDNELRAHLNGRAVTLSQTPPSSSTTAKLRISRRANDTFAGACRFSEIILISGWTVEDIQKAEGYLAHKYGGLPLSRLISTHPYKTNPPTI
jgi:hypothetical protein